MTQAEVLLWEIEKRGNRITSRELMTCGVLQYQARLKELREKLLEKGWELTFGEKIEGQKGNFMYRLIKPPTQSMMFEENYP